MFDPEGWSESERAQEHEYVRGEFEAGVEYLNRRGGKGWRPMSVGRFASFDPVHHTRDLIDAIDGAQLLCATAPCPGRGRPRKDDFNHGPLFRRLRRGGHCLPERLAAQSIAAIVARRAADAGIEGRVSGHSLRAGAAQSLAATGASLVEMQTAGRWTSPTMPGRYIRGQRAARGAVARLRYGAGQ